MDKTPGSDRPARPLEQVTAEAVYPCRSVVGEGCVWDPSAQVLYWVDILDCKVYRFDPGSEANTGWHVGAHVGCVAPRSGGGLVLALQNGFATLDPSTGEITTLVDPESHLPENRFNDGKCDPEGRLWAGTMSYSAAKGAGSLYCLEGNGRVAKRLSGVTISNGLCWDGDASTFYFIDSATAEVRAYDYEPASGEVSNPRVVAAIPDAGGLPDGMTIDEGGFLWVALWGGGKVIRIDPESGATVFEVLVPAAQVTSAAFGGPSLEDLYITTADYRRSAREAEEQPLAGSLFRAGVPFRGVAAPAFRG